jgi:hypothetical protein
MALFLQYVTCRFMVGTARDPRLLAVTHQLLVTELEEEAQVRL